MTSLANGKTGVEILRVGVAVVATLITLVIYAQARGDRIQEQLHAIDVSVAAIEASRFTADDGQRIWQEFSALRQEISGLPQEAPPTWFEKRVNDLDASLSKKIDGIHGDILDLRSRLQRLEERSKG